VTSPGRWQAHVSYSARVTDNPRVDSDARWSWNDLAQSGGIYASGKAATPLLAEPSTIGSGLPETSQSTGGGEHGVPVVLRPGAISISRILAVQTDLNLAPRTVVALIPRSYCAY
jgi:hypothetical protein